ncbi:cytochrome c oxidase assembly protein [Oceanibaculum pacificum]|uniref:Cytochrome c oxidase assembly protein n=1 Tax=Oceanibaculum pacificum TaxID=580166 RepID=A0A154VI70_9PROT|nr:cytochrome c oxidase assembly protein [Oceanibaculum pacificum]KZD01004.1 hypothetical protein AUP43_14160 [Oceanibaculum pacificum]
MNTDIGAISYCGAPPVPGALHWNLDPLLLGALALAALIYGLGCRAKKAPEPQARWLFYAGWLIAVAALVTPLCNLSVALFSARVGQHLVLTLVAAPLIAMGQPERVYRALVPARDIGDAGGDGKLTALATLAFALALWTWHLPGPYDATLRSDFTYWIMHITTFGAAYMLWHALLRLGVIAALFASFATAVQMSLLGGVLTLAPTPLFEVHALTTRPWGLSPLLDQQLGGLLMWVPGGLLFTVLGLMALNTMLRRMGSANTD